MLPSPEDPVLAELARGEAATVASLRVGLHVTDRCQLDCDHCSRDPAQQPVDLDLAVIERVLRSARARGAEHVSMTGGEPTLHPRFPEILDLVASLGMTWDIVSNGRRFERLARWLDEAPARKDACRLVMLSMDGATDEVHDRIRGAGQRREVLAAMSVLVAAGVPFGVAATLHALNLHEIEALVDESAALGASVVRFAMTQPTGTPLDETLRLDAAAWRAAADRVRARAATASIPVLLAEGWPGITVRGGCLPLRGGRAHVDVHGRLTLCCVHSGSPSPKDDPTVVGSAAEGLTALLLDRLDHVRTATTASLAGTAMDPEWADFECNRCLALHGRPHWTGLGASGTMAKRERWHGTGARSNLYRKLRVVP